MTLIHPVRAAYYAFDNAVEKYGMSEGQKSIPLGSHLVDGTKQGPEITGVDVVTKLTEVAHRLCPERRRPRYLRFNITDGISVVSSTEMMSAVLPSTSRMSQ